MKALESSLLMMNCDNRLLGGKRRQDPNRTAADQNMPWSRITLG